MTKQCCRECKKMLSMTHFHKNRKLCKKCYDIQQTTRKRTLRGRVLEAYHFIRRVSEGRFSKPPKMWTQINGEKSINIPEKEEFIKWALNYPELHQIHRDWVKSNYSTRLTPTLCRIDPRFGYELTNLCWLTKTDVSPELTTFIHGRYV